MRRQMCDATSAWRARQATDQNNCFFCSGYFVTPHPRQMPLYFDHQRFPVVYRRCTECVYFSISLQYYIAAEVVCHYSELSE